MDLVGTSATKGNRASRPGGLSSTPLQDQLKSPQGGHSAHTHTGGSVKENIRQPKNITSASAVHEHKIS